jgi:hypothetical protein
MQLSHAMTAPVCFSSRDLCGLGHTAGTGLMRKPVKNKADPIETLLSTFGAAFRRARAAPEALPDDALRMAQPALTITEHFLKARSLLDEARPRILPDDAFSFSDSTKELQSAVVEYLSAAAALLEGRGATFLASRAPLRTPGNERLRFWMS